MAKPPKYTANSTPQALRNLSGADMAKLDKQAVSSIDIPPISQMLILKVGKMVMGFHSVEKYEKAKEKYHHQINHATHTIQTDAVHQAKRTRSSNTKSGTK